jgi:SpoVK/Ycf46/Vps4 family AAA+-type ATPase
MGPLRELMEQASGRLSTVSRQNLPPISGEHFRKALSAVRPSVSQQDLQRYIDWNSSFGSYRIEEN